MIQAYLNGKSEISEDTLTSTAFGNLLYLGDEYVREFLGKAKNLDKEEFSDKFLGDLDKVTFWPHDYGDEPDIVMHFSKAIVIVEVKFGSGITEAPFQIITDDGNVENKKGQITRYYFKVEKNESGRKDIYGVFLTSHPVMPIEFEKEIEKMDSAKSQRFFWLSWRELYQICEGLLNDSLSWQTKRIAKDLCLFLDKLGLRKFKGFSADVLGLEDFSFDSAESIFYIQETHYYWKLLKDLLESDFQDVYWSYNKQKKPYWELPPFDGFVGNKVFYISKKEEL